MQVAGLRIPKIQEGCLYYVEKKGEVCPEWEAAPPRSPVNTVSALLSFLRDQWNEAGRSRGEPWFEPDDLVASFCPILQNVWRSMAWFRSQGELAAPPFLDIAPRNLKQLEQQVKRLEKWLEAENRARAKRTSRLPENPKLQKAFDFIREHGPKFGKEIAKHIAVKATTFRSSYAPRLKEHFGVQNQPSVGYFVLNEQNSQC